MRYRLVFITLLLVVMLQACSRHPNIKGGHLITVEPSHLGETLYYSGTIQPLRSLVITSPAEGVIVDMPFQYGEQVTAGQLLFLISSSKFLNDYKTALMQYVKAKSEFNNSKTQLSEAEFLHKNELISDDDYKGKQSNYYTAQLALVQAKDQLGQLIQQSDIKTANIYDLSIADIDKITEAMHLQMSSDDLRVIASATGVVLSPEKSEEETKTLNKGDTIKQGDVLVLLGDMTGLSVRIKVNELTVNQLQVGQKVKVTGIAFPDDVLTGQIKRVDRQGSAASGGMPAFSVEIMVPRLTALQQKNIHVGMTAKVEIDLQSDANITIPLTALHVKHNQAFVKRYNAKTKIIEETEVKTGKTTPDTVAITAGLSIGDQIVIPN